jgi:hypothetical protein
MLLVVIDKFDLNPVLVNYNKMEPYRFVEGHTLNLFCLNLVIYYQKNQLKHTSLVTCSLKNWLIHILEV